MQDFRGWWLNHQFCLYTYVTVRLVSGATCLSCPWLALTRPGEHIIGVEVLWLLDQVRLVCLLRAIVGSREDVYMADALVSQVETAVGRKKKLGFGLIIEATMGCSA